jgi:hypothetical protein
MSFGSVILKSPEIASDFYRLVKNSRVFTKTRDVTISGAKKDTKIVKEPTPSFDLENLLSKTTELTRTPKSMTTTPTALIPTLNRSGDGLANIADQLEIIGNIFNSFLSNSTSNSLTLNMTLLSIAENLKTLVELKQLEADYTLPNSILKLDELIFNMYGIKPDGTIPVGTDNLPVSPLEDKALLNREKHIEEKRSNKTDHGKELLDLFPDVSPETVGDIGNPFNLLKNVWTLPDGYTIPNNLKEGV